MVWHSHPGYMLGLILNTIILSIFPLGTAWLIKTLFDLLVQSFQNHITVGITAPLLVLLVGLGVLNILSQALGAVGSYLNTELALHLNVSVQLSIYRKINSLQGLAPFETPHFYDMIQLSSQGAQMGLVRSFNIVTSLLRSIIILTSFLGVLISYSPILAVLVAMTALPQLYVQTKLGRQRFGLANENNPKQRRLSYYGHLLSGRPFAKEMRLFDLGAHFLTAFERLSQEINQIQRSQQRRELLWKFGLDVLSNMISTGALGLVVFQAIAGRLSLGDITFYTSAVGSIQGAFAGLVSTLAEMHESALFFTRYNDLLALPQPIAIPDIPHRIQPPVDGIEFRNVSFRYSEEHSWVLRDVNFVIPAGQCLALVGLNGAGKTTLVKLLTRLYDPTEGQILWDGIDLREFDPTELRRRLGVIFQDFVRFDLTVLENVALGDITKLGNGNSRYVEAAALSAAMKAGIHDVVSAFPKGYHTMLSRWLDEDGDGVDLSGGQWQKIALARLFIRDADLLILDEPTSALDAKAEYEVYNYFSDIVAGKTSLLISHRFSTVRMADLIAVLEDGKITEYGSHDELMSQEGTYARLYIMQAERYR